MCQIAPQYTCKTVRPPDGFVKETVSFFGVQLVDVALVVNKCLGEAFLAGDQGQVQG